MTSNSLNAPQSTTPSLRQAVKSMLPTRLLGTVRPFVRTLKRLGKIPSVLMPPALPGMTYRQRASMTWQLDRVSKYVRCSHNEAQMLSIFRAALSMPSDIEGCLVEAGCFKGGSSAKFSLLAEYMDRRLELFDSFQGLPDNDEEHGESIFGMAIGDRFEGGRYAGALEEVKANVRKFGCPERCSYHQGWFDDTLPSFSTPVCFAYIDVDLVSSTKTCLKYLYPLLSPGGILVSQDGHLPLIIEAVQDESFWREEVGCEPPPMDGVGTSQLIMIHKPAE